MTEPLVTVAIATYNGERYLQEQLDTIYAQTWRNLEVVASDDASTDGTLEILARYGRERGLRFAANEQRVGLVANFERAMRLATGDLIALSDQDDIWKPKKIATLVENLGTASLIYGNCQDVLTPDGQRRFVGRLDPIYRFMRSRGTGKPTRYLATENWVVSHTMLFRRELLGHALPIPASQPYQDGWLAFIASLLGGIRYFDGALQIYRQHSESYTYKKEDRPAPGVFQNGVRDGLRYSFRARALRETARLNDALSCPLLSEADRRHLRRLIAYYRAGLERGYRWSSFLAGLTVASYFHTAIAGGDRWKVPFRPLLRGR